MPVGKVHIISSWPNRLRDAVGTLSIAKASAELAQTISKLDVRNVTVCSAVASRDEILNDQGRGPKLAYLFRPTDVLAHREVFKKCTHVQLLIHEQDIIEKFFENSLEYLKGKVVGFLSTDHANLFARYGIQGFGTVPIPTERFPETINTSSIIDLLKNLPRPRIVIMSNNSVRKNLYKGILACMDAIGKYGDVVNLDIVVNAGLSTGATNITDYFPPTKAILNFYDTPSKKDMYTLVSTGSVLVLPSIDEGYNMVLREMGRTGIDIVCSDISVNREYKLRNKDCKIVPLVQKTIFPSSHDEIARPIELGDIDYKLFVEEIYTSLVNWQNIKERMIKRFESPGVLQDSNLGYGDLLGRFLSIPKPTIKVGNGIVNIL